MLLEFVRRVWSPPAPPAPTRPLSLQDLAAGACISTGYLSRVFRQHYKIGPPSAFELLRLARAATLLARSNLSAAAVAHHRGLANPDHFSRRFYRSYGQPPGLSARFVVRIAVCERQSRADRSSSFICRITVYGEYTGSCRIGF
jgi:AraC family transcriptional regulator